MEATESGTAPLRESSQVLFLVDTAGTTQVVNSTMAESAAAASSDAPAAAAAASAADTHKESEAAIKGTDALRAKGAAHEDPAEAAYMKSLIGDKDIVRPDGRRVVIEEFRIIIDGDADDIVYKLNTPELVAECKKKPFEVQYLKERQFLACFFFFAQPTPPLHSFIHSCTRVAC